MNVTLIIDVIPRLLHSAVLTIELTVSSILIGFLIAVPLALLRTSSSVGSRAVLLYTFLFRGTPLLVQLFLVYYGASQIAWVKSSFLWAALKEPYWCALFAFSLNHAAYATEILRGGIRAVPLGEIEAAKALGMSYLLRTRRIILPIAFRLSLPAYGNEVVLMLKASSLASAVTLMELTGTARKIVAETFSPYEVFILAALVYLTLTFLVAQAFARLEHNLTRHRRRRVQATRTADLPRALVAARSAEEFQ